MQQTGIMSQPSNHPDELWRKYGIRVSGFAPPGQATDAPRPSRASAVVGGAQVVTARLCPAAKLCLKALAAICTFGVYPLAPWAIRINDRRTFRRDVRNENYRRAVRRKADQQRRAR